MKLKQIAAFVLVLYAAIFVAFAFHNHLGEQPGKHCNVCQTMHSPSPAPGITTYAPALFVQGSISFDPEITFRTLLVYHTSDRAPPTL